MLHPSSAGTDLAAYSRDSVQQDSKLLQKSIRPDLLDLFGRLSALVFLILRDPKSFLLMVDLLLKTVAFTTGVLHCTRM